jgi:uncharacterized membrane protein YgdD (TMEM256/DUF423 family)
MPSDADWFNRLAIVLAGILGAAGTAAAAGASHAGDQRIFGALALIALANAPALLAFGLLPAKGWLMRTGALVIAAGAILFCADLAARHFWGSALFPMSAPFGGTAIIAGWLIVALAGLLARRG